MLNILGTILFLAILGLIGLLMTMDQRLREILKRMDQLEKGVSHSETAEESWLGSEGSAALSNAELDDIRSRYHHQDSKPYGP